MARPKPTPSKRQRKPSKPDWDALEIEDYQHDCEARERKRVGPGKEAAKLLNKRKKRG